MKEITGTSTLSVKEYAKLINKSDKTVYKMIKEGLIMAKKEKMGYEVLVDSFLISRCNEINKSLRQMKEHITLFTKEISALQIGSRSLEKRVTELESKQLKKSVIKKKLLKPLKKVMKKPIKKTAKKVTKKTIKKGK